MGKSLVEAVTNQFDEWGVKHGGLCTFPQSPLHIALYGKFGYRARFLTPIMAAPARIVGDAGAWSPYSDLPEGQRREVERASRELTDMLYDGLDLCAEIRTVTRAGSATRCFWWKARAGSRDSRCVIGDRRAKPAKAAAM